MYSDCLLSDTRYCNEAEVIYHFRVTLIDDILIKLLWQEYLLSTSMTDPSEDSTQSSQRRTTEAALNVKHHYSHNLGKCIIKILSGMETDLLSVSCLAFQDNCLEIIKQGDSEELERVVDFFVLLEQHAVQQGETWPLAHFVGPMLSKSFPLIRSLVSHYFSSR